MSPVSRTMLLALCMLSLADCSGQQEPAAVAGQPAAAVPQDPGWPRTFAKEGNEVMLYQPQIDDWQDHTKIACRMALALQPAGEDQPVYGVLAVKADTVVDNDSRLVLMTNLDVDVRFPNVPEDKAASLEKMVREVLPRKDYLEVSLDRALAYMDADKAKLPRVQVDLNPPPIYYSQSPAILVIYIGKPQFKPVKDTRLMFAVNTNWDLLLDLDTSRYYLLNGDSWLTSPDPTKGPWTAAGALPASFAKLPADANWEATRKAIPGKPAKAIPKVFVSTEPAELILTNGAPEYTPIPGTKLLYVSNPEMPLFLDAANNNSFYYLVAGRWFSARTLDGPWSAASTDLPADFSKIPPDSAMGRVLASIPNTQEAKDAILLAAVPHKATINITEAKADVTYDGPPEFQPIEGTSMTYAVNSPQQVIGANGQYYCCYQGVWFASPAATGPWAVCTAVPPVIYTIPPTSPMYNVTYVNVYGSTPDTVTVGYTSGYSGAYVAATGTLMFGAGMLTGALLASNDSWYTCSPAFYSYGCGARYNYSYGGYYRASASYYGPYGGAGHAAAYNSATGTFSRGAYAYGPAGAAGVRQAYNPYTGAYAAHAGATNGYQSWGRSYVSQGSNWAEAGHKSGPMGSAGWAETSSGRAAAGASGPRGAAAVAGNEGGGAVHGAGGGTVAKTSGGDVYAGKDGNVYRNTGGQWQHYSDGGWQNAEKSSSSWSNHDFQSQMNHDWQSRSHGNEMQSHWGGGGFDRGGGGFGGGGFHGGGGRR